jgi:hypothetical protein
MYKLTASKAAVTPSTNQSSGFGRRNATIIEELKDRFTKIESKLHVTRHTDVNVRVSGSGTFRQTASLRTAAIRRNTHAPWRILQPIIAPDIRH